MERRTHTSEVPRLPVLTAATADCGPEEASWSGACASTSATLIPPVGTAPA